MITSLLLISHIILNINKLNYMVVRLFYKPGCVNMWPFHHHSPLTYPTIWIMYKHMATPDLSRSRPWHPTIRVYFPMCSLNMSLGEVRGTKHIIYTCSPRVALVWLSQGYFKAPLMYLCTSSDNPLSSKISLTSLQSLKMYTSWITCYPPLSGLAWPPCRMTHIHGLLGTRPLYPWKSRLCYLLMSSGFTDSFLYSRHTCRVYLFKQKALHWFTTYYLLRSLTILW